MKNKIKKSMQWMISIIFLSISHISFSVPPPEYCSIKGGGNYEWIAGVAINALNSQSGQDYYKFFENPHTELLVASNSITLTPGFSGSAYKEYWSVWIDYNKNFDFTDPGELVVSGVSSKSAVLASITPPAFAAGKTIMRVAMQYQKALTNPCANFTYGEVEDYNVIIAGNGDTPPIANANGPYTGTVEQPITLSSEGSYDPNGKIRSWLWEFGDGSSGIHQLEKNPTHTYKEAGVYHIRLTVTDNDGEKSTATTTAEIKAACDNTQHTVIANPNGPYYTQFSNPVQFSSAGSVGKNCEIESYLWDFGDDTTSTLANPSHEYQTFGSHTVSLTIDNLVTETTTVEVTDCSGPPPHAEVNGPYSGLVGQQIQFSSEGSHYGGSCPPENPYYWDFGDGNFSKEDNPKHSYSKSGTYNVSMTAGGYSTASTTVTITTPQTDCSGPPPKAVVNGPYIGTVGESVQFSSEGSHYGGSCPPENPYYWKFGDGHDSKEDNPKHIYSKPGTYTVTMTASGYSTAQTTVDITLPGITDACATQSPKDYGHLSSSAPICVASNSGGKNYFYFHTDNNSTATIKTQHGAGDIALYYGEKSWPSTLFYTAHSDNEGNTETIKVNNLPSGWHYIMLKGIHSDVTLLVETE
ncbi:PKD domain-containing protein [Aliikangiella sp. IMCC44359]|uniref:PKD domain-containing protein n=1 Tax=Aliikangiella sp. IMCC44359 TaxID=3459125 RepID=UPI00403B31D6